MARRKGRGRLSTIDRLPDEAWDDVQWAIAELGESNLTQVEIREELNRRLVAKGFAPISNGAFNRHSLRLAEDQRQMREGAEKFRALYRDIAPQEVDQTTVTITELMKTVLLGMVTGSKSTKEALELARAIQATVGAQKGSIEHKRKLMGETKERTLEAIDKVGAAVAQTPDGMLLMKKIREGVYGIFE